MRLRPIEQASLANRAYEAIRAAIVSGKFEQGAPLTEVELGKALGISRTPIREALFRLREDGLVDAVPGGGNVVHTPSSDEVRELFVIREALEQLSVREAAVQADAAGLTALERLVDEQRKARAARNVDRFLDADEQFHFEICRLAGLPQTADLLISLRERMRQAGLGAVAQPDRMDRVIDEHVAILKGLQSKDGDRAAKALYRHLTATRVAFDAVRSSGPG